jgi:pyruvate/2-oxoglutarate/acetoin dehydrogenase E1 component
MPALACAFNFEGASMKYFDELKRSMDWLAEDPRTLFLGQAVAVPGTAMSNTLKSVDPKRLLEMPVAEEMQMGMTVGLALAGRVPVSIFPRWNFLLLSINQLINHLDKLPMMARGGFPNRAIIRTGVGSERPLHPHCQHVGDFTEAVRAMCTTIEVIHLEEPEDIFPAYQKALLREDGKATIVVEYGDYYGEKCNSP